MLLLKVWVQHGTYGWSNIAPFRMVGQNSGEQMDKDNIQMTN